MHPLRTGHDEVVTPDIMAADDEFTGHAIVSGGPSDGLEAVTDVMDVTKEDEGTSALALGSGAEGNASGLIATATPCPRSQLPAPSPTPGAPPSAPDPTPAPGPGPTPAPKEGCTPGGDDPYHGGTLTECCTMPPKGCLGPWKDPRKWSYQCTNEGERCKAGNERDWCHAESPLKMIKANEKCTGSDELRILSYNLFWWNLFKQRKGGGAGHVIKKNGPFDIMGFQECEDINWVMNLAGLNGKVQTSVGGHSKCIAFDKDKFSLLNAVSDTNNEIAEDGWSQHYGKRGVHWVRLKHKSSGKTVLFANHHGPLPVDSGGLCGTQATAYNMVNKLLSGMQEGDIVILVGDFNAGDKSGTQMELMKWMYRIGTEWVDAVFSTCSGGSHKAVDGGGSDHRAQVATVKIR